MLDKEVEGTIDDIEGVAGGVAEFVCRLDEPEAAGTEVWLEYSVLVAGAAVGAAEVRMSTVKVGLGVGVLATTVFDSTGLMSVADNVGVVKSPSESLALMDEKKLATSLGLGRDIVAESGAVADGYECVG